MKVCKTVAVSVMLLALWGCSGNRQPTVFDEPVMDTRLASLPLRWWEGLGDPVLDRFVEWALADNLDLAAATERVREQRAYRRQANSRLMPAVAVSGRYENGHGGSDARDEDYFYGLDLAWELDLFGRLSAIVDAAEANQRAAQADYQALRVSLVADVVGSYLDYRLAQREEAIARQTADAQAETVRITQVRLEQGTASGLDLERFTAQLAVTRAAIPAARARGANARYTLAYLLNRAQEDIDHELHAVPGLPKVPDDARLLALLELPAERLRGRADVRAAEWRLQAAGHDLEASRALRFPQLTLGGLLGVQRGVAPLSWSAIAQGLQPLIDFGEITATIAASDARQRQAAIAYRAALITALRETRSAISAYGEGQDRRRLLGTAVVASTAASRLARRQYESGTISLFEVLDAERSLFDAQLDEARATTDVQLRWVEIYRTVGLAPADASF